LNFDIIKYYFEYLKYKEYITKLFWYQKYKGFNWIYGQNFGDYLSIVVVANLAKKNNFKYMKNIDNKLLSIGSILHFAKDNDIVWGSGINGKIDKNMHKFNNLDVRMVRGPLTKKFLESKNIKVNDTFGDPALLLSYIFPDLKHKPIKNKIILIPNLNEFNECKKIVPKHIKLISPLRHWKFVLDEILSSEIVYTSSLHGLILSEVFKIPVVLFKPFISETIDKYEDYILGTNRSLKTIPKTFIDGFDEKNGLILDTLSFDYSNMLHKFPTDLFGK